MPGMPPGFAALIQRKYDILQQQADANMLAARSGANLDNVRAGLMPDQVRAEVARQEAEARLTAENTKQVAPLARANIGLMGAQSRNYISNAGLNDAQAEGERSLNLPAIGQSFGMTLSPSLTRLSKIMAQDPLADWRRR